MLKQIVWEADTRETILAFPRKVREDLGYALDCILNDFDTIESKAIPEIGPDVQYVWTHYDNYYYIVFSEVEGKHKVASQTVTYLRNPEKIIHVLHVFSSTSREDITENLLIAKDTYKKSLENME